jgi:hypothetical protein
LTAHLVTHRSLLESSECTAIPSVCINQQANGFETVMVQKRSPKFGRPTAQNWTPKPSLILLSIAPHMGTFRAEPKASAIQTSTSTITKSQYPVLILRIDPCRISVFCKLHRLSQLASPDTVFLVESSANGKKKTRLRPGCVWPTSTTHATYLIRSSNL